MSWHPEWRRIFIRWRKAWASLPQSADRSFLKAATGRGAANILVRQKGGWWESLEFIWGFANGEPYVQIFFFVRRGADLRKGRQGCAHLPAQKRGLLDIILGRNKPEPVTIDSVIAKMREVITELDQHLDNGADSPRIIPAVYVD